LIGLDTIQGRTTWILDLIPKPEKAVVWGKLRIWVTQNDYLQLRIEHYDQRMQRVSVMDMSNIRELGGRILPTRMELIPDGKTGHRTILIYHDMNFNVDLGPEFFSQQHMRRVR